MIPALQGGHHRHVVGFEHVETGGEDIGQLAFVHEHGGLALANGELGAVLDFVPFTFEAPDQGVAGVVDPVNDVDEFAGEKIENAHGIGSFRGVFGLSRCGPSVRGPGCG